MIFLDIKRLIQLTYNLLTTNPKKKKKFQKDKTIHKAARKQKTELNKKKKNQ